MSATEPGPTLTGEQQRAAASRADFMKRFFSVAVSVGFASKIGRFTFLSSIRALDRDQVHQAVLLVFAMIVIIGSWEFYFRSIDKRPLKDMARFVVDIIIVSTYIILLLSVSSFNNFLLYLDIIMFLYVVWDILTMKAYPDLFGMERFTKRGVVDIYKNGFLSRGKPGPAITLWWFAVFLVVAGLHLKFPLDFFFMAVGVAVVYISYRIDQSTHWPVRARVATTASILVTLVVVMIAERECCNSALMLGLSLGNVAARF